MKVRVTLGLRLGYGEAGIQTGIPNLLSQLMAMIGSQNINVFLENTVHGS